MWSKYSNTNDKCFFSKFIVSKQLHNDILKLNLNLNGKYV